MLSSTPEQVLRHPTNSSPSKHHWSFSKAERFGYSFDSGRHYDVPTSHHHSSYSFGKAKRAVFTVKSSVQTDKSPAPGTYSPVARSKGTAWSFTKTVTVPIGGTQGPGPGSYEISGKIGTDAAMYTLRPKTEDGGSTPTVVKGRIQQPGPAAYVPKDYLDSTGNYFVAKYPGSRASTFSPAKNTRFDCKPVTSPGPGAYNIVSTLTSTGDNFVSVYKSSQSRRFGKATSRPVSVMRDLSPGPASYTLPSEFGTYGAPYQLYSRRSSIGRRAGLDMELIA